MTMDSEFQREEKCLTKNQLYWPSLEDGSTPGSNKSGCDGELVARWMLEREGWKITEAQAMVMGHKIDFLAKEPETNCEWLVEVKVWGFHPSGKDTVKKAIADAYDLRQMGESRPYMLLMSHKLRGLLDDMIGRAIEMQAVNRVMYIPELSDGSTLRLRTTFKSNVEITPGYFGQ